MIPAQIRREDGILPGEQFELERAGPDEYRLVRIAPAPNSGVVDWLLACPEKGYFVGIESESTDSL